MSTDLQAVNGLYAAWLRARMFRDKVGSKDIRMLSVGYMIPGNPPEAEIFFLMDNPTARLYMQTMVDGHLAMLTAQLRELGMQTEPDEAIMRMDDDGGPEFSGRDFNS